MTQVAAVIGVGFVGRAHVEALRRLNIRVKGAMASTGDRSSEMARTLGLEKSYATVEEIAADKEVTVVHVCTPNYVHFDQSSKLLRAGKHVQCEKPLAMDSRESEMMVKLVKETKRLGGVTHNLRYYPLCQEARALVESGAIGQPRLVYGHFLQDWLFFDSDWNWRLEANLGGELRAVSDIGTHWMDLTMWLTGKKITEVCADLATVIPVRKKPRGRVETFAKAGAAAYDEVAITTDDYASVLLQYEDNVHGVVTVSQVSAGRKCRLWWELVGSKGSLVWNGEESNTFWLGKRDMSSGLMVKDLSLMSPAARGYAAYPGGHAEGYPDTFVQLFKDFYAYIEKGDMSAPRTFPTFETGHDELLLCDAIQKSAQERAWTQVEWD